MCWSWHGCDTWEALSVGEHHTHSQVTLQTLHHQMGEQRFASLSDAEKGAMDFSSGLAVACIRSSMPSRVGMLQ